MAKKLLISVPCRADEDLNVHLARFLISCEKLGQIDGWDIETEIVDGIPVTSTKNEQVRRFLWGSDADALLVLDDDMVPGIEGLRVLLGHLDRDDVDVVSAITLRKDKGMPTPVLMKFVEAMQGSRLYTEILAKPPGLHEVRCGSIPGACFIAKRAVYQKFVDTRRVWHTDIFHDGAWQHYELANLLSQFEGKPAEFVAELGRMMKEDRDFHRDFVGTRHWGHDAHFCRQCIDLGIRVWIDTRVLWGHMKHVDLRQLLSLVNEVRLAKGEKAMPEAT